MPLLLAINLLQETVGLGAPHKFALTLLQTVHNFAM